ncbi:R2-like ligand-binding oxidase [Mechercharimyces sp. CAU 1602]|uniref:R2-like ligand-binding oxidase n=1 Tax=Mechercharimyces sp. CAU 1602 TaxID=2973933 RepID=UPI00216366EC|nr:R2-like ligand-binding oxidase [Mechercharimyces sp. CAU 1602]MCS1350723.1 R2-like ligand-binding oxidase [Mechercharimyces sp. CAU 1602]
MREQFVTMSGEGWKQNSFPYRLYRKAKKLGVWDPEDIDFTQDRRDWDQLDERKRWEIMQLISQFQAGEEAVTLDLLPLIMVIAKEGRLDEEMYLTTFLFEEAKHTEFFRHFLNQMGENGDLTVYHTDTYKQIFQEILPTAMTRLEHDHSRVALVEAATVYNLFVEGVLAETGYYSFHTTLEKEGIMPGLLQGIALLKKDEARHISYGTYLLQRCIAEDDSLYDVVMQKMEELIPYAIKMQHESIKEKPVSAFGTTNDLYNQFMMKQAHVRMEVLKRARGKSLDEVYRYDEEEAGTVL